MIEILLVIFVGAAILVFSLNQYHRYQLNLQYDLIQSDIATIKQALNSYYNTLGCAANGTLPENLLDEDVIYNLPMKQTLRERLPYVTGYHAHIIDSGVTTEDGKPVYQLQVRAHLGAGFLEQLPGFKKRFAATKTDDNSLLWISLPNTSMSTFKSATWVLNESREQFRRLKNTASAQALHSYCAH